MLRPPATVTGLHINKLALSKAVVVVEGSLCG